MARIEKTVFISYRRKDISWALAVYQYLTSRKYDVFFDFSSIPSGDFEQIIISNIKARAHFILILTPTALDRCNNSGDWLRREIEIAIDEKRNIIPLFFDDFNFGNPAVTEKLTGKLTVLNHYNGLEIPPGYFIEAMERLRSRYLNVPLNAVLHPVSTEVRKVVKEEQVAADKALLQKNEDIQELIKPAKEKHEETLAPARRAMRNGVKLSNLRAYGIGAAIFLALLLGLFAVNYVVQNTLGRKVATPTNSSFVSLPIASATWFPDLSPTKAVTPISSTSTPRLLTETVMPKPSAITSSPTLGMGSTWTSPKDGMVMVYVPAGEFTMGSDSGSPDEKPVHKVYLDAFWIDQTEVTNAMYAKCVNDRKCKFPHFGNPVSRDSYYGDPKLGGYPVIFVSWDDAQTYCTWSGRRLPTEAEWEKAASWNEEKQQKFIYPWGNSIDCSFANYCEGDPVAVGSYYKGRSPYGVLNMAGNVYEWVSSLYRPYPYDATDSREALSASGDRVIRGGAWEYDTDYMRSADRSWNDPSDVSNFIGFRCARSE